MHEFPRILAGYAGPISVGGPISALEYNVASAAKLTEAMSTMTHAIQTREIGPPTVQFCGFPPPRAKAAHAASSAGA